MIKKGELYYPGKEFQKKAFLNNNKIYKEAAKDPLKFWDKIAKEILWQKPWEKTFVHNPPYIKWFDKGELNITENALDRHLKDKKDKPAIIWQPESISEDQRVLTYGELASQLISWPMLY